MVKCSNEISALLTTRAQGPPTKNLREHGGKMVWAWDARMKGLVFEHHWPCVMYLSKRNPHATPHNAQNVGVYDCEVQPGTKGLTSFTLQSPKKLQNI